MKWIRSTLGFYINLERVFSIVLSELKSDDWAITAISGNNCYQQLAIFTSRAEAQAYLDALMKRLGSVIEVSMADWNYQGHKKTRKETRRGGS